jgi:hypothetical protein
MRSRRLLLQAEGIQCKHATAPFNSLTETNRQPLGDNKLIFFKKTKLITARNGGQISGIVAAVPREAKTVSCGSNNRQVYQEQVKTSTFGTRHMMDE